MNVAPGRDFPGWLRTQLHARRMSQRQLARRSGVDHSTICRLVRGERIPSLRTATLIARGLRELRDDVDPGQYLKLIAASNSNPAARVEYALRADDRLDDSQVRRLMGHYLAERTLRADADRAVRPPGTLARARPTGRRPDRDRRAGG